MDCLHPMAPDDDELLRFALDGEILSTEASEHLEQCSNCQRRLVSYTNGYGSLVSRLYRSQCPDGTQLSLYCADLLPADQRVSIASHLLVCPLCAAEVVDTQQFLADTADEELLPAFSPERLHTSIPLIFATLVKQRGQLVLRGELSELGLSHQYGADSIDLSQRGEPSEPVWPRQYHVDSIDLSLHLSRASSGQYILLGIITDPTKSIEAFNGIITELYPALGGKEEKRAKQPLLREQVDELGNLVLSAVPVGEYVMIVHLPGREMVIEGLSIGH